MNGTPASIADLPGLGPKSQEMLVRAGINNIGQLRQLGAVAAYVQVRRIEPRASLNLLWGLESALSGLPWQQVARRHRTSLLLAVEAYERASGASTRRNPR
jgi:DNA transformation protein